MYPDITPLIMSWMFATCLQAEQAVSDDFCALGGRGDRRFRVLAAIPVFRRGFRIVEAGY